VKQRDISCTESGDACKLKLMGLKQDENVTELYRSHKWLWEGLPAYVQLR